MSDAPQEPQTEDERPHQPPPRREGRRGRGTRAMHPERPCLNCGDPTPGEYCPTCGQRKVDVQVSVRTLVMDVLEDQFILDKRLPRSLGALFFKPGHMTVEHVNGRIVRYIHPFRLFLVTSLVFFLFLSFFSLRLVRRADVDENRPADVGAAVDSLGRETASLDSTIARLDRQVADTTLPVGVRATLRSTQARLTERRAEAQAQLETLTAVAGDSTAPDTLAAAGGAEEPQSLNVTFGWDEDPPDVNVGIAAVDSALAGQIRRLGQMPPRQAAETLVGTFFNYAPTMMFILLPLFAAVLKLLYVRRGRFYAEHFVFLLHVHSFVFILATVMLLVGNWVGGWLELALALWILVYIYLAMKRVYGQGWLKTLVKYWILGWTYVTILTFTVPLAFVATLFLF